MGEVTARASAMASAAATARAEEVTAKAEAAADELRAQVHEQGQAMIKLRARVVAESAARGCAEGEVRGANERTSVALEQVQRAETSLASAQAERAQLAEQLLLQQQQVEQLQSSNESLRAAVNQALQQRTDANAAADAAHARAAEAEAMAAAAERRGAEAHGAAQAAQESSAALRPELERLQQRCDEMAEQVSRRDAEVARAKRDAQRDVGTDPLEGCILMEQAAAAKLGAMMRELRAAHEQCAQYEGMLQQLQDELEQARGYADEVFESDDEDNFAAAASGRHDVAAAPCARGASMARALLTWYRFSRRERQAKRAAVVRLQACCRGKLSRSQCDWW